jgi:hypothetical protein
VLSDLIPIYDDLGHEIIQRLGDGGSGILVPLAH